jgi:hypothetical protein
LFQLALLAPLSFPFFLSLSLLKNKKLSADMDDNDDDDFINEDNFIYDEIRHRRQIAHRTNWHFRAAALTQRDVALVASIQASLSFCYSLMYLVISQLHLLNQWIQLHNNEPNTPLFRRILKGI